MFNIKDRVLFSCHGACTIVGIETMRFGKTREKFYVLQPLQQPDSRYYVPVDNGEAVSKLSPLMSREALLALLHSEDVRKNNWIADESLRKQRYKELIGSGDRSALLNMIYCLHQHKKAQQAAGKKFHQCDDNFLHDAQKLLNSEFALVFGLEQNQVNDFILSHMNQEPDAAVHTE